MTPKTFACPLCNGFISICHSCPNCTQSLVDYGPVSFLLGSYSPYRPIDDSKQNDGLPDNLLHQCPHEIYCPNCGFDQILVIHKK